MNNFIDQYNLEQHKLFEYMDWSTQNVSENQQLYEIIEVNRINSMPPQFYSQISSENEPDILVCLNQQVSNYLLRLSQNLDNNAQKIKSKIAESYNQFILNFRQINRSLSSESKKQVAEILETRKEMCKTQEEYLKLMKLFALEILISLINDRSY